MFYDTIVLLLIFFFNILYIITSTTAVALNRKTETPRVVDNGGHLYPEVLYEGMVWVLQRAS